MSHVTTDPAGNIYTVDVNPGGVVTKISPDGTQSVLVDLGAAPASAWVGPYYDPVSGDLFVGSWQNGTIIKIDLNGSGGFSVWATGLSGPAGLTGDAAGNIYVAEGNGGLVSKITPDGSVRTTYATGLSVPDGIDFGPNGDLYVGNRGTGQVMRVPPGGGPASVFASGFGQPFDVLSDSEGNVYTANITFGTISKISPAGAVTEFGSGFSRPHGIVFDASGSMFISNAIGNVIHKVPGVG